MLVETALARDDGVRTLYRYMRYPALSDTGQWAQDRRTWVQRLLSYGEIYFPLSSQFNDPFETRPHCRVARRPDGSLDTDVHARALRETYGPKWGWSKERIEEALAGFFEKARSGELEIETELIEATWANKFRTEYPMCCLSPDRASVPMWSYYTESHAGVCVHFDATIAPFGTAMRVLYRDEYPVLPLPLAGVPARYVIQQSLLIKARAWEHEQEYRLIDVPNYEGGPRTLDPPIAERLAPQLLCFHPRHIVGVTCGACMQSNAIEQILRICEQRRPRLPVWKANVSRRSFALTFEPIHG
jgi:hypothetical protein